METLFYVGLIFVLGALMGWVSSIFKMPRVVGYLILGLLIGPEVSGIVPYAFVENSHLIIDLALSIIAVLVGATIRGRKLKGYGKDVTLITLFQSIMAFVVVTAGFVFINVNGLFDFSNNEVILIALFLGAIATATAPATSMAIVHELRAKGKFTSIFLTVVAADDAISLIIFSLALAAGATILSHGTFEWSYIVDALELILFSSFLGAVAALINTKLEDIFVYNKGMETISTLGLIFIVYSLSEHWHLEPLLSAMVMGIVMVNTSKNFDLVEEEIDSHLVGIIFMLFFVISAMHLNFGALISIPFIIVTYILLRFFGKVSGAYLGAILSGSSNSIKRYMGLALLPQAGVAIGMALSLQKDPGFSGIAPIILNIVIATTLVHEIIGPLFTRYALEKSGDAHKDKLE